MTEHIGIIACSPEGAALCYRTICIEASNIMGRYAFPEITMHSFSFKDYMQYLDTEDWEGVARLMLTSTEKVATAGASFAICPDNTIHQSFDLIRQKSPIPWLHIAEEVAAEAVRQGYIRLGVLGTRSLMEGPVYSSRLANVGIEQRLPSKKDRERINSIIFDQLVEGRFYPEARTYFNRVIAGLKKDGCDAVILGCTEIPLLLPAEEKSPLPKLDSTRLLAMAALHKATGTIRN
jgi:aspartate racemase